MNPLVFTIGLMFVGSGIGAFLTQGTRTLLAVFVLGIGLLVCVAGVAWSRVQTVFGPAFAESLAKAASDARVWLILVLLSWLALSTMLFVRRTSEAATTTTALQAQLLTVKNDLSALQFDYERFKTPRALTQKQFDGIVDFLSTREAQTITIAYIRGDRETRQYAMNFRNALVKAGWNVTTAEVDDASYGVCIDNSNARTPSGETKAGVLLRAAFKEAGVELASYETGGDGGTESTHLVFGPKRD